jgi:hypothetical protein
VPRLAVSVLVLAVLLVGCAGGTRKPRLSPHAFVTKVNAICARATTRTGLVARLHAVRPPLAYQDLYSRWLKAERDAIDADKAPPEKTTKPLLDRRVATIVAEGKIAGLARRLGAETCAKRAIATMSP